MSPDDYDQIELLLANAECAGDPAEAHGTLCGLACALGETAKAVFVAQTMGSDSNANPHGAELFAALNSMADNTLNALAGGELDFQLLVPPDRSPAKDRVAALASWSGGFLHGLASGLAMVDAQDRMQSEPLEEITGDLLAINQADLDEVDESESSEQSILEIGEYLRVVVQLGFESLDDLRRSAVKASADLH